MRFSTHPKKGRPCLHRPRSDKGTPELQQKRHVAFGSVGKASLSLLGLFYARTLIPKPFFEAGCHFEKLAWKYRLCISQPLYYRTHSLGLKIDGKGHDSSLREEEEVKYVQRWNQAVSVLQQAGIKPYHCVMAVTFCDQDLYQISANEWGKEDLTFLRKGLGQLDHYFTHGQVRWKVGVSKQPDLASNLGKATILQGRVIASQGLPLGGHRGPTNPPP